MREFPVAERRPLTAEEFEQGYAPTMVQDFIDGKLYPGTRGISPELVLLFREVRALRADVARLLTLVERKEEP